MAAIDDTAMEGHGSRNGTLWKGARLNPHQKMPCVVCADNCALVATYTGRRGGLAHGLAPAQRRISGTRRTISTRSRSARLNIVSDGR